MNVALDLGGGSTQITFAPSDIIYTLNGLNRQDFAHTLRLFGSDIELYTHRFV